MPGWPKRSVRRVVWQTFLTAALLTLSLFFLACNFASIWLVVVIARFRKDARVLFWLPLAAWVDSWLLPAPTEMVGLLIPMRLSQNIVLLSITEPGTWLISVSTYIIVKTVEHHRNQDTLGGAVFTSMRNGPVAGFKVGLMFAIPTCVYTIILLPTDLTPHILQIFLLILLTPLLSAVAAFLYSIALGFVCDVIVSIEFRRRYQRAGRMAP